MENVNINVLEVCDHFKSNLDGETYGLYKIEVNGDKKFIFRNGSSWGVLSHYIGEPVTECMNFMRDDMVQRIENEIEKYLNGW